MVVAKCTYRVDQQALRRHSVTRTLAVIFVSRHERRNRYYDTTASGSRFFVVVVSVLPVLQVSGAALRVFFLFGVQLVTLLMIMVTHNASSRINARNERLTTYVVFGHN